MSVWPGLGFNYKALQANWAADAAYFKSIGATGIRPHMPGTPRPWNQATNAYWRDCSAYFAGRGFFTTWGVTQNNITASMWPAIHDSIVAEALYLQQQNISIEFELGNESESALYISLTSVTQTSGVATATSALGHNLSTGDSVTINGSSSGYNGTYTVTVTGSTTFTFPVSSSLVSPSLGTMTANSMTISQFQANIRQLAIDVKAVYTIGTVSYACWNFTEPSGMKTYTNWINTGIGVMDTLSIHPYANISTAKQTMSDGGYPDIAPMVAAFGNKVYISEWNLDAGATNMYGYGTDVSVISMKKYYNWILQSGINRALMYTWVGYQNANNDFAMKYTNGDFAPIFDVILTNGGRRTFTP